MILTAVALALCATTALIAGLAGLLSVESRATIGSDSGDLI